MFILFAMFLILQLDYEYKLLFVMEIQIYILINFLAGIVLDKLDVTSNYAGKAT
jgi:hypothetical protein